MNPINILTRKWNQISLLFVLVCSVFVPSGNVMAACSTSFFEKAYLNEYYFGNSTNYLEVFIPNNNKVSAVDWSTWNIRVYTSATAYTDYPISGAVACSFGSKTYLTYEVAGGLPGTGGAVNVVLYDGSGNEIDYLKFDNSSPIPVYTAAQCGYLSSHDIDLVVSNYGNKDVSRFPDGKGDWSISSLTGANTTNTRCASNDATIIKTVSSSSIAIGASASFTITVFNPSNGSLNNVMVTDLLPTGLILDSYTATVGTYTAGTGVWNIGNVAKNTGATLTINFHGNTIGSYTNTATMSYTGITYAAQDSAIANIIATVASFNAFESATAANAITGLIKTKVAGSAFGLDVVAISSGAQSGSFTNAVKVELLANTGMPGVGYGADNCPFSNSVIQTIATTNISGGRSTVNFSAVANSYRDVRVRVSYPTTTPTVSSCSTNSFAIRPSTLATSVTDTDWLSAGTTRTLNNTAASGGVIHKAGRQFTVNATAYNAADTPAVTTNYAATPTVVLSSCTPGAACTAGLGSFVIGADFVSGILSSNTASYSEAGSFNLQLQDTTYAVIDAGDSASDCTAAGYYVCSDTMTVGRFVPDHFDTVIVTTAGAPLLCASGMTCPALNKAFPLVTGMIYSGQPFSTQVTARNAANATTVNYSTTTGLAKVVTLSAWDVLGGSNQNPGPGSLTVNTIAASTFSAGVATTSAPLYTFSSIPTTPTDIYIRAQDTENISSLLAIANNSVEGGVKVVSGRVKVSNAYGSELLPLTLTATSQFYSANGWLTSTTDNSTSLVLPASYVVGSGTSSVTLTPLSGTLSSGVLSIRLGRPGSAGIATVTPTAPVYLPVTPGIATFGVYSGSKRIIYQRESY